MERSLLRFVAYFIFSKNITKKRNVDRVQSPRQPGNKGRKDERRRKGKKGVFEIFVCCHFFIREKKIEFFCDPDQTIPWRSGLNQPDRRWHPAVLGRRPRPKSAFSPSVQKRVFERVSLVKELPRAVLQLRKSQLAVVKSIAAHKSVIPTCIVSKSR